MQIPVGVLVFWPVLVYLVISDVAPRRKYVRIKHEFDGDVLQRYTLQSATECTSFCRENCRAVQYFTGSKDCVLYKNVRNVRNNTLGPTTTDVISYKSAGCPDDWVKVLDSCYLPKFSNSNWSAASQFCTSHSGHLAVITSQEEQDNVIREFNASMPEPFWIGGTYDESSQRWSWINGEQWNYSNLQFKRGQGQNCLNIYLRATGPMRPWAPNNCTLQKFALCEQPLV